MIVSFCADRLYACRLGGKRRVRLLYRAEHLQLGAASQQWTGCVLRHQEGDLPESACSHREADQPLDCPGALAAQCQVEGPLG